ncbi:unnamed protein product, partial [Polarella glacialis]
DRDSRSRYQEVEMEWSSLISTAGEVWNRLQALGHTCGAGEIKPRHQEAGLSHVFALHPLADEEPEAVRATQRGARLLHEGRVEESIRELHDARQLAPRCTDACNNLGCAYQANNDDSAAIYWYREALRLASHDETAVMAMALLEQRRGQVDEAQKMLVNFLQAVDSSHIGALRQLGRLHQREGHWSQAAGCFHRLIAIDPTNCEWPTQLQICMDQVPLKDNFGQAVPGRAFSFAERHAPADAQEQLRASSSRARGGYGGDLSATSTTCSSFNGDNRGFQQGVGSSSRGPGQGGRSFSPMQERGRGMGQDAAVSVQLGEARRQRENGRPDAALGIYRGVLRIDGRNTEALLGFADCQQDLGSFDAALEAVKQLLSATPDDPEANLRVAELLLDAGHDVDTAEPYLRRASQGDLGRSRSGGGGASWRLRLLCVEAEAALAREEFAKAMASASEAVRLDASSAKALLLLGHARLRVADYQASLRAVTAALDACGSSQSARRLRVTAHCLAAQAHERLREYPQAMSRASQALEEDPEGASLSSSAARVARAMALQQSGQAREAEAELMAVLQRNPQHCAARLQLAYCQLSAGDSARAAAILEALLA